jgi:formate dehydrogenase alpha subunit
MALFHITINGQAVEASSEDTILQAAQRAGIHIPTLCYHPALPPEESCRVCVVELIRGRWRSLVAACVYPVREGMVIETDTAQVFKARKTILELILSDHPLDCMTCNSAGNCELQDLAYQHGIQESAYSGQTHIYPLDSDPNQYIHWDMNKCVMCRRCIRACSEVQCAHVLTKADRGFHQRISTAFGNPLEKSGCEFDGQCVAFCPVDALSEKMARGKGRAWEMTRTPTVCPLCACGCVNDVNQKGLEVIKITSNFSSPANQGALCFRGRFRYQYLNKPERLQTPLLKKGTDWAEAGWDETLEVIAGKIRSLQEISGPESLGFLLSPGTTNEDLYLWSRFAQTQLKTGKTAVAGSAVWTPALSIQENWLGLAGATNPTADLAHSAGILVVGSHLLESHPIVGIQVRQSVRKGAKLLLVEDKPKPFSRAAQMTLTVALKTEALLLQGLVSELLRTDRIDRPYLESRASGLEALRAETSQVSLESVAQGTGCSLPALKEAVVFLAENRPLAVICPPPFLPGEPFDPALIRGLIQLQLLAGSLGKPGGGLYLLPGPANALGAYILGAARADFTETELLAEVASRKIRGLIILAEDPQGQSHLTPEQVRGLHALRPEGFLVVQDLFLSDAAQLADVVLPARPYVEKTGTFMNLERRVQSLHPSPAAAGTIWGAGEIVAGLARIMGLPFSALSPAQTLQELARTDPEWAGFTRERLTAAGLQWPCSGPDHPGTSILFQSGFPKGSVPLSMS